MNGSYTDNLTDEQIISSVQKCLQYRNLKEALKHQDAYLTRIAMLTSEKEGIKIFKREAPFCCYNGSDFNGSKRC